MTKAYPYAKALDAIGSGEVNFGSDIIGVLLLADTYTLDAAALDAHEFVSDVSADEAAGTAYARVPLTATSWGFVDDTVGVPGNVFAFAADPTTFTALGSTGTPVDFQYAAIYRYDDSGGTFDPTPPGDTDSAAQLLVVIDFETTLSSIGADFVLQWSVDGVTRLRASQVDLGG